ncbi:MAG: HlyD family efflux transporter periplasmic adaptor subunit, partial [Planctomycetota bacterium]
VVRRVLVGDAASVKRGQPLVELDSAELRIDRERIEEEIAATESEIAAARAAELRRALRPSSDGPDESALAATLAGLRERLKRQHERRALLDAEAQRLVVRSPAAGTVVSWRPEETLVDRPVRRGQRLLEVVGGDAWRLRLPVPDRRSGPVLEAAAASTAPLRVRYVVRSDPSRTHEARVAEIAPTSHPDASGASVVRVVATPAGEAPPLARDGLGVTAKIDCGRHPALYAWLHEAIAAVRRLWF